MKKTGKKLISVLTALLLVAALAGCTTAPAVDAGEKDRLPRVGIVQLAEHAALDSACEGFIAALAENGFVDGETVEIDLQNAQGDQSNLSTIGERFLGEKVDLILAIATPAAQAMAGKTTEIPILATAVTDYESAKLVNSNAAPGGNVSGTTDMNPIKEQIALIVQLAPDTKTIGCIYTSSEVNSEIQFKAMKEYAESKGLKVEAATISTVNDIQQAAQSLVGKVDAFYEPTDNIIASAMPTLISVTNPAKKPVICGESNMVKAGGLATYGVDYYQLGKQAGMMAADILEGKAKPADMPIQFAANLKAVVNKANAAELGIALPAEIMNQAEVVE